MFNSVWKGQDEVKFELSLEAEAGVFKVEGREERGHSRWDSMCKGVQVRKYQTSWKWQTGHTLSPLRTRNWGQITEQWHLQCNSNPDLRTYVSPVQPVLSVCFWFSPNNLSATYVMSHSGKLFCPTAWISGVGLRGALYGSDQRGLCSFLNWK